MGLNEVALGIPVPRYWIDLMVSTIGQRPTELALQTGSLMPTEHLLKLSMVDAAVEKPDELIPHALEVAKAWLKNPDHGRVATKAVLRQPLAERWSAGAQDEAAQVWATISDPATVAMLKVVMERLAGAKPA